MGGIIVPIFFFGAVAIIWGGIILTRHRERMTIIERGLNPEDMKALYERGSFKFSFGSSLKWGMVFVGIGLAILIGLWLRQTYNIDEGVFPGLISLFGGLGLVIYYVLAGRKSQN